MEEFRNYINTIRRDFSEQELNESSVTNSPYQLFEKWFDEAVGSQILDPFAMIISTVSEENQPSSRVVYMRDISEEGLVFYTNYNSDKGKNLTLTPRISALFFWGELARQIRVEGEVEKVTVEQSDTYFKSRPRESQIGAWASDQSSILLDRSELEQKVKEFTEKFEGKDVPRPLHWGGYRVKPCSFEFWQGRASRLHDRIVFFKDDHEWKIKRLSP